MLRAGGLRGHAEIAVQNQRRFQQVSRGAGGAPDVPKNGSRTADGSAERSSVIAVRGWVEQVIMQPPQPVGDRKLAVRPPVDFGVRGVAGLSGVSRTEIVVGRSGQVWKRHVVLHLQSDLAQ